jgi:hypothetical protein
MTSILESSLKNSGTISPLNLSPTMAQRVTNLFHLTTYLCQYPSRSYILFGLIKEYLQALLTCYTHTTRSIYFIFIDRITLTVWRQNLIPLNNATFRRFLLVDFKL